MKYLVLVLFSLSAQAADLPQTKITDKKAGYDQAAYDACVDSSEDLDCEKIIDQKQN